MRPCKTIHLPNDNWRAAYRYLVEKLTEGGQYTLSNIISIHSNRIDAVKRKIKALDRCVLIINFSVINCDQMSSFNQVFDTTPTLEGVPLHSVEDIYILANLNALAPDVFNRMRPSFDDTYHDEQDPGERNRLITVTEVGDNFFEGGESLTPDYVVNADDNNSPELFLSDNPAFEDCERVFLPEKMTPQLEAYLYAYPAKTFLLFPYRQLFQHVCSPWDERVCLSPDEQEIQLTLDTLISALSGEWLEFESSPGRQLVSGVSFSEYQQHKKYFKPLLLLCLHHHVKLRLRFTLSELVAVQRNHTEIKPESVETQEKNIVKRRPNKNNAYRFSPSSFIKPFRQLKPRQQSLAHNVKRCFPNQRKVALAWLLTLFPALSIRSILLPDELQSQMELNALLSESHYSLPDDIELTKPARQIIKMMIAHIGMSDFFVHKKGLCFQGVSGIGKDAVSTGFLSVNNMKFYHYNAGQGLQIKALFKVARRARRKHVFFVLSEANLLGRNDFYTLVHDIFSNRLDLLIITINPPAYSGRNDKDLAYLLEENFHTVQLPALSLYDNYSLIKNRLKFFLTDKRVSEQIIAMLALFQEGLTKCLEWKASNYIPSVRQLFYTIEYLEAKLDASASELTTEDLVEAIEKNYIYLRLLSDNEKRTLLALPCEPDRILLAKTSPEQEKAIESIRYYCDAIHMIVPSINFCVDPSDSEYSRPLHALTVTESVSAYQFVRLLFESICEVLPETMEAVSSIQKSYFKIFIYRVLAHTLLKEPLQFTEFEAHLVATGATFYIHSYVSLLHLFKEYLNQSAGRDHLFEVDIRDFISTFMQHPCGYIGSAQVKVRAIMVRRGHSSFYLPDKGTQIPINCTRLDVSDSAQVGVGVCLMQLPHWHTYRLGQSAEKLTAVKTSHTGIRFYVSSEADGDGYYALYGVLDSAIQCGVHFIELTCEGADVEFIIACATLKQAVEANGVSKFHAVSPKQSRQARRQRKTASRTPSSTRQFGKLPSAKSHKQVAHSQEPISMDTRYEPRPKEYNFYVDAVQSHARIFSESQVNPASLICYQSVDRHAHDAGEKMRGEIPHYLFSMLVLQDGYLVIPTPFVDYHIEKIRLVRRNHKRVKLTDEALFIDPATDLCYLKLIDIDLDDCLKIQWDCYPVKPFLQKRLSSTWQKRFLFMPEEIAAAIHSFPHNKLLNDSAVEKKLSRCIVKKLRGQHIDFSVLKNLLDALTRLFIAEALSEDELAMEACDWTVLFVAKKAKCEQIAYLFKFLWRFFGYPCRYQRSFQHAFLEVFSPDDGRWLSFETGWYQHDHQADVVDQVLDIERVNALWQALENPSTSWSLIKFYETVRYLTTHGLQDNPLNVLLGCVIEQEDTPLKFDFTGDAVIEALRLYPGLLRAALPMICMQKNYLTILESLNKDDIVFPDIHLSLGFIIHDEMFFQTNLSVQGWRLSLYEQCYIPSLTEWVMVVLSDNNPPDEIFLPLLQAYYIRVGNDLCFDDRAALRQLLTDRCTFLRPYPRQRHVNVSYDYHEAEGVDDAFPHHRLNFVGCLKTVTDEDFTINKVVDVNYTVRVLLDGPIAKSTLRFLLDALSRYYRQDAKNPQPSVSVVSALGSLTVSKMTFNADFAQVLLLSGKNAYLKASDVSLVSVLVKELPGQCFRASQFPCNIIRCDRINERGLSADEQVVDNATAALRVQSWWRTCSAISSVNQHRLHAELYADMTTESLQLLAIRVNKMVSYLKGRWLEQALTIVKSVDDVDSDRLAMDMTSVLALVHTVTLHDAILMLHAFKRLNAIDNEVEFCEALRDLAQNSFHHYQEARAPSSLSSESDALRSRPAVFLESAQRSDDDIETPAVPEGDGDCHCVIL